ncbi:hypothetical protein Ga0061079_11621 [Apibacter mensalis]|uniref:Uncharacterized protein n=1 Tax=Apibacter mensalis TaxID=1586267 RepID=A0A0X3APQ7_9FLAO|nr:hypothetical protein [Apibacter mensalis]CVK17119.1 hypothetical protein Ga0061079_11621 [Apibacter mensalis]
MDKIFEKYPKINVYYKTNDGNSFFSESDAKNHAKSLDNKLVQPICREFENIKVKEEKALETDKNSVDESIKVNVQAKPTNIDKKTK